MKTKLNMKMQMRISPQLILAGELLRLSGADLEHRVSHELKDNPALDLINKHKNQRDYPEKSIDWRRATSVSQDSGLYNLGEEHLYRPEFEERLEKVASQESILGQLTAQASLLVKNDDDLEIVTTLLYSLDEHGYLRDSTDQLALNLNLDTTEIERLIQVLHELEPPGVGARDLRECLLIQCRYLEADGLNCSLAKSILEQAWDDLTSHRWDRIAKNLGVTRTEVDNVWNFIVNNLYPYPLAMIIDASDSSTVINVPDLIIHRSFEVGRPVFSLEIPAADHLEIRLSGSFINAVERSLSTEDNLSSQERDWLQSKLESARLFITSLQKRWDTLRRIGEYVIEHQQGFLEYGPTHLKLLNQSMVAKALNCHESTVSRAVSEKIVQLPDGRLKSMAEFFDSSIPVKAEIQQILSTTRQSISDREIAERLTKAGYSIARRTVTKYRAQISYTMGL